MERSDVPHGQPQANIPEKTWTWWQTFNPCPDGQTDCKRCLIDFAIHLANQEIEGVNAKRKSVARQDYGSDH